MRRFRRKLETSSAAVARHILRIKWHAGRWMRRDSSRRVFGKLDEKQLMRKTSSNSVLYVFPPLAIEVMLQCLKLETRITEQKRESQAKIQLKEMDGLREYVCDCEG